MASILQAGLAARRGSRRVWAVIEILLREARQAGRWGRCSTTSRIASSWPSTTVRSARPSNVARRASSRSRDVLMPGAPRYIGEGARRPPARPATP